MYYPLLLVWLSAPQPPQIVFLEQPSGWVQPTIAAVQIFVGLLQAFVLWKLNHYIFRRGAEQKMLEREADWFHETVVEALLPQIDQFFSDTMASFTNVVAECARFKALNTLGKFDESASEACSNFTTAMIPVRRSLVNRMTGYDPNVAKKIATAFLDLEGEVTEWFDSYRQTPETEARSALFEILSRRQNEIYSELRQFELTKWRLQEHRSIVKSLTQ